MKLNPESLLLYAVTYRSHTTSQQDFLTQIKDALAGGVTCVQLREKNLLEDEFTEEAIRVKELCKSGRNPCRQKRLPSQ